MIQCVSYLFSVNRSHDLLHIVWIRNLQLLSRPFGRQDRGLFLLWRRGLALREVQPIDQLRSSHQCACPLGRHGSHRASRFLFFLSPISAWGGFLVAMQRSGHERRIPQRLFGLCKFSLEALLLGPAGGSASAPRGYLFRVLVPFRRLAGRRRCLGRHPRHLLHWLRLWLRSRSLRQRGRLRRRHHIAVLLHLALFAWGIGVQIGSTLPWSARR